MSGKNDITGDTLISKTNTKEYNENYDKIFNKEKEHKDTTTKEQIWTVLTTNKKETIKDMDTVENKDYIEKSL